MTPAEVISLLQAGEFTEIHDLFVPQLRPLVSAEAIQTAWAAALTEHGALIDVGEPTTEQGVTRILLTFERGRRTLVMTIGGDGQLGSLQLAPASAAEPVTLAATILCGHLFVRRTRGHAGLGTTAGIRHAEPAIPAGTAPGDRPAQRFGSPRP
jgi:hypothetical protein